MHPVLDQKKRDEIVALVRKYLEPYQPSDYTLDVDPETVEQEDDWYYVVVEPSREDVRSYQFSSLLAEAELDLQEKEKDQKILLVPVLPS